ncbi:site-specific recombinase XerD [Psychrobacillus insolitus]|uniref:Site-specific recombinase XerD n=1 Tax=Psychrobacillus insolitus TaxID=1461 RepID=A0A2W7MN29_9BACI|nr:site-specific integrase [Psychrobacillus insolitus]PZX07948.1 site-specific recombinase XerD [Psychrobacillus insolitus]
MTSYKEIGENKYKIYIEQGYDDRGKRKRKTKTVTAKGPRELNKKIKEFEFECMNNHDEGIEEIRFSSLLDRWWDKYVVKDLARTTISNYKYYLNELNDYFGKMKVSKIKRLHIEDYLAEIQEDERKSTTKRTMVLKSIFHKAYEWEIIDRNPMEHIALRVETKEREIYDEDYITDVFLRGLDKVKERDRVMLKMAYYASARRGEVLGLAKEDFNFVENTVTIKRSLNYDLNTKELYLGPPKGKKKTGGGKTRVIELPNEFMEEVHSFYIKQMQVRREMQSAWETLDEVDLFFRTRDYRVMNPMSFSNQWAVVKKKLGLKDIPLHALRHSSASLLVSHGANIKDVQERLGHSSPETTLNTYVHTTKKDNTVSVNILRKTL